MRLFLTGALLSLFAAASPQAAGEIVPDGYRISSVPFTSVSFDGGLLAGRVNTVRDVTIPFAFDKCEKTGRIDNFAKAAGLMEGEHVGRRYDDSDVFKIIGGASYSLATRPDPVLDHYLDSLISLIAGAQEDDGYLFTIRTAGGGTDRAKIGPERWSSILGSHELYNVGHLYEAAAAHFQATGKRTLLDVALRNADMLNETFPASGRKIASGHEEIELALVRLYQVTGDRKYLDLSKYFLDCKGVSGEKRVYYQNHQPVTEQRTAVGHAVRAMYLYMAMTDIAAIAEDKDYRAAVDAIWADVCGSKMYLTGGIGSRRTGESFGEKFELPNDSAYCETCAAIGWCMWNYRMFSLTGDAIYMDVFERALYNNVLDGISEDGMSFFYPNKLEFNPDNIRRAGAAGHSQDRVSSERQPWFATSCCPSNLARFIPSLPGYAYAAQGNSLYVNLYASGSMSIPFGDASVALTQKTSYPWSGTVDIHVEKAPSSAVEIRLRIPGWAVGKPVPGTLYKYVNQCSERPSVSVNGEGIPLRIENGYAVISRVWKAGDAVSLYLPMPVRIVKAGPRVSADKGRVAVERGPVVYCIEEPDVPELDIRKTRMGRADSFVVKTASSVYGEIPVLEDVSAGLTFIPWFTHAHRGIAQMAVFISEPPMPVVVPDHKDGI
ncbi:MAG: glycoside hydrolase family 127 protein [Bacteroidales bacterium]|nr:glycoside hydrolase family 127 protein [Bacteroidales bacterium]